MLNRETSNVKVSLFGVSRNTTQYISKLIFNVLKTQMVVTFNESENKKKNKQRKKQLCHIIISGS